MDCRCKFSEFGGRWTEKGRKRLALSEERCIFAKMEDERKTNKQVMLGELGKYCIDISKLVFGGVVLAGIMKLDVNLPCCSDWEQLLSY